MTYIGNQTCTGPAGVHEYLTRHGVQPDDVDAAFTQQENIDEIERAVLFGSFNYYPAQKIAERMKWILTEDPAEDDDDDDDDDEL